MDMVLILSVNLKLDFLFLVTCVVGTHWNCLTEAIPLCTHKMCLINSQAFHHKLFLTNPQLLSLFH